ncbi:MAG: ABC transporter ATP-binding protein [Candidatus Caldarchaeum sp.]
MEYKRDIEVLKNVSLEVAKNSVTVLIGPNGAGKSTLLKTVAGLLKPKKGEIWLDGVRIDGMEAEERVRHGLAIVLQRRSVFTQMTIRENLLLGAWRVRKNAKIIEESMSRILEIFPDLASRLDDKAGSLSGGQQRMLEIARSLMTQPKVLLLDEPSAGLSPIMVKLVYQYIEALKNLNITIFLVDQNIEKCFSLADYVYVLELGEIRGGGRKNELTTSLEDLIKMWLYLEQKEEA